MYISSFLNEEFGNQSNTPYIIPEQETNLLNLFCPNRENKIQATKLIVDSLVLSNSQSFSTTFHVKWAMEFLGYAFSLPIENYTVIENAFEIYRKWIITNDRPKCIEQNEDFYQKKIIGHFSLLFVERGGSCITHSKLCTNVLILIKQIMEKKIIKDDTWNFLLKIFLLISESILSNLNNLSQNISHLLIFVLFEVWIRSNTRDMRLWKELEHKSSNWLEQIWLIKEWGSVILQLTKKMICFLYGEYKSLITIEFIEVEKNPNKDGENKYVLKLEMDAETSIFYWHNFLNLMLNHTKSNIPSEPNIHKELTEIIAKIIEQFLDVCDKRNFEKFSINHNENSLSILGDLVENLNKNNRAYALGETRIPIPNANSILDIFGEWLFFHSLAQDPFSEFGNTSSIGTLCKVICKAQGPINQIYLNRFYEILYNFFNNDFNQFKLGCIVSNSQTLFGLNHKGVRILAYEEIFLNSIKKLLGDPKNAGLKRPCCIILSSIVGLNRMLGNPIKFELIKNILFSQLKLANEADLLTTIIWTLAILASTEDQKNASDIANTLVSKLQDINYKAEKAAYNILLDCISCLPRIIPIIDNPSFLIDKLCSNLKIIHSTNFSDLIIANIFGILNWVICYPGWYFSSPLHEKIKNTLSLEFSSKNARESAEFVQEYLKNSLISSFEFKGSHLSSGIIKGENFFEKFKHYLYKSEFILSIYDIGQHNKSNRDILYILRNSTGKYIWSTKLDYCIKPYLDQNLSIEISPIQEKNQSKLEDGPEFQVDELYENCSKLFESQNKILLDHQNSNYEDYSKNPKIERKSDEETKSHRMLLSQMGFYNEKLLKEVKVIENDIIEYIDDLDQIPEKDIILIPIFYILNSETKLDNPISYYSESFVELLNRIGIPLSLEHKEIEVFSHLSYLIDTYNSIIYSSECLNEIVFIAQNFSSCDKKELSDLGNTIIIWNELADDPYSLKLPSLLIDKKLQNKTVIELIPFDSNIVKVKKFGLEIGGPLLDGMLINSDKLPKLLISTIINSNSKFNSRIMARLKRCEILKKVSDILLLGSELPKIQKFLINSFF